MDVTCTFSERLRKLRGRKSLQEVADSIGITRVALGYYEKGERKPDIEILYRIASYYNVTTDFLLGNENCQTHDTQFIYKETGLSEQSIKAIQRMWLETLTKEEKELSIWNDCPDVPEMQYSTALSSTSALQEYWNKYGEVIDGYEKEDPEDYIENLINEKKNCCRALSALNTLLSHPAGEKILENLYAYLNFEYKPTEEEKEAAEKYNAHYGTNYKSVIKGKNGYVNSEYLNISFLTSLQHNCMELKDEITKKAPDAK